MEKLRALGYPVDSTSGVAGGYHLGAAASLPPLLLDDEEALAVALGLRTAATSSVSGAAEAAARALSKLERVLPSSVRRRLEALGSAIAPLPFSGPAVDPLTLGTLAAACQEAEVVYFEYTDRTGTISHRSVEPHGVVCAGSRWYLAAWDPARESFRTCRLDRIDAAKPAGKGFARRTLPEGSASAYVARSVATGPYSQSIRVIIRAPYGDVANRVPPLSCRLEALDEERCLLEAGGRHPETLVVYIAALGFEFDAVDPPELPAILRRVAERLVRAAGRSGAGVGVVGER